MPKGGKAKKGFVLNVSNEMEAEMLRLGKERGLSPSQTIIELRAENGLGGQPIDIESDFTQATRDALEAEAQEKGVEVKALFVQ